MRPLKILQIIDRLDAGGAERVMVDLSNILHEAGHQVTTLAILNHGELGKFLNPEIKKINLKRSGKFNLKTLKKLSAEANEHDVLHVHMRHNLKYVWLANKVFPMKATMIFHDHYGKIEIDRSVDKVLYWALKKVSYIGVSQALADWAIKDVGLPPDKVHHLTNIIIQKDVPAKSRTVDGIKQLILVSNIRREKHIEFAIEVMSKLVDEAEARLTIYGKVVDQSYFQELKTLISNRDLSKHINFVDDCIDIQAELSQYDFALHTAKSETGPLVLIEYLAQGLPFITYQTGEVVKQINGVLPSLIISNFEVAQWVNALKTHWDREMKNELIEVYNSQYSKENYYQQCLKIYQKSLTY